MESILVRCTFLKHMTGLLIWANNINVCTSNNSTLCVKRQQWGSGMNQSCFITTLYTGNSVSVINLVGRRVFICHCSSSFPWFSPVSESIDYAICLRAPVRSLEGAVSLPNELPPLGGSPSTDPHSPCTTQPGGGRTAHREKINAVELRLP